MAALTASMIPFWSAISSEAGGPAPGDGRLGAGLAAGENAVARTSNNVRNAPTMMAPPDCSSLNRRLCFRNRYEAVVQTASGGRWDYRFQLTLSPAAIPSSADLPPASSSTASTASPEPTGSSDKGTTFASIRRIRPPGAMKIMSSGM